MFDSLSRRSPELRLSTYENVQNAGTDNGEQGKEKCATSWE